MASQRHSHFEDVPEENAFVSSTPVYQKKTFTILSFISLFNEIQKICVLYMLLAMQQMGADLTVCPKFKGKV